VDARDFFIPEPDPKPSSQPDQGGFALGGPIRKNRTFFFVDFEKVRNNSAFNNVATVPTMAERQQDPDFSAMATNIYDPTLPWVACPPQGTGQCRPQVRGRVGSSSWRCFVWFVS
jgi:hypothetical protein